jgi:DNA-directed RNA polymerase specialized sigma24 family protein
MLKNPVSRERRAAELRFILEWPVREIALVYRVTERTVYVWLARFRKQFTRQEVTT